MNKNKDDTKRKKRLEFYKKIIETENYEPLPKETTVIYDGKQFSIRIPKDFAELVGVKKGDIFSFWISIPAHDSNKKPKLWGEWFTK